MWADRNATIVEVVPLSKQHQLSLPALCYVFGLRLSRLWVHSDVDTVEYKSVLSAIGAARQIRAGELYGGLRPWVARRDAETCDAF